MKRTTILLFDIDGTLIDTGGAGRRAMERAFAKQTGRADACRFGFDGMTDRSIARKGLSAIGHEPTEQAIDDLLRAYLDALEPEVVSSPSFTTHPGVERALEGASRRERTVVGLGTGNVREGARIKLERPGLFERFSFGGFGCDHEERAELLRVGAARGAKLLEETLENCRVVVIGDTPKDVAAALAIGAECLAVATGRFGVEELFRAGATRVVRSLAEDEALGMLLEAGN